MGQATLENLIKKIKFEDEKYKEMMDDFKRKVMEDLKNIRQERIELEKVKVEIIAKENNLIERMEKLEEQLKALVENDKGKEAGLTEMEDRYEKWARGRDGFDRWRIY